MPIFINLPNDVIGNNSKGIQSQQNEELDTDNVNDAVEKDNPDSR